MHVLIIPSWYRASEADTQGSFFREQAHALKQRGYQVGIIHPQHRSMMQWKSVVTGRYGFEPEDDDGIPTLRIHTMTWFPRQIPYINYLLWVRNGLALYRQYVAAYGVPEVVHAHGMMYGGLLAWTIQSRYHIPFVLTEHGTAYARNLFAPWELRVGAKAAAAADCKMAVSEAFCQELTHFLGGQWMPCANVVPQMFTHFSLNAEEPLNPGREEFSRPSSTKPFVFTTVAYLSVRKGIHHLIEAFANKFKDDSEATPDAILRIGGEGKERDRLQTLAKELGVEKQVMFLGALDRVQVRDLIAETDVFVLASGYETFGVVVIEALALGKPVISTRCGGPNQVVRDEDGLLIEPGDVDAIAQAMQHLKTHYNCYDPVEIRQACIDRFGEDALVERLSAVYQQVTAAPEPVRNFASHYA